MTAGDVGETDSAAPRALSDELVFRELYPALRRFAAVVGSRDVEPDDLVQEALARTLARHSISDLTNPVAYLRQVVVRVAISGQRRRGPWRRASRRLAEPLAATQPMPSDVADLDDLNPVDRAVIWLVDIEGYTHREAADLLGLTAQASRTRASRARAQLREGLEAEEAHP